MGCRASVWQARARPSPPRSISTRRRAASRGASRAPRQNLVLCYPSKPLSTNSSALAERSASVSSTTCPSNSWTVRSATERSTHDRARYRDTLLLAPRQLAWVVGHPVCRPDAFERCLYPLLHSRDTGGCAVVGTISIIESNRELWGSPLFRTPPRVHTCGMDLLTSPEAWIALGTLTILEIVLGIDNIVFITVLADRLPREQRPKARQMGLALAMLTRILLLFTITLIMRLTTVLFTLFEHGVSGRDVILIIGGLFLLTKSTREIHDKMEGEGDEARGASKAATFAAVLTQIAILDIVFSLDSVITAVGMADDLAVMVTAVILAVGVMMISAGPVGNFVSNHPTVKMLALSFLLLIGMSLIADGVGFHIPKGYIYFAMGFSVFVESLNLRAKGSRSKRNRAGVPSPTTGGPSASA